MKIFLALLTGLTVMSAAHATTVHLVDGSPHKGKMTVEYHLIYQNGTHGKNQKAVLPTQVTLDKHTRGIDVTSITNKSLPTPNHHFVFPKPACQWHKSLHTPPRITFSIGEHRLRCY